jgi:hypothetical protein
VLQRFWRASTYRRAAVYRVAHINSLPSKYIAVQYSSRYDGAAATSQITRSHLSKITCTNIVKDEYSIILSQHLSIMYKVTGKSQWSATRSTGRGMRPQPQG